jgi:hypothetical protein
MFALVSLLTGLSGANMALEDVPFWTSNRDYARSMLNNPRHKDILCGYWNGICSRTNEKFGDLVVNKFHYLFWTERLVTKEFHISNEDIKVGRFPTYDGLLDQRDMAKNQLKTEGFRYFAGETTFNAKYEKCGRKSACNVEIEAIANRGFNINEIWKKDSIMVHMSFEGARLIPNDERCDTRYTECWEKTLSEVHLMLSFTTENILNDDFIRNNMHMTLAEYNDLKKRRKGYND